MIRAIFFDFDGTISDTHTFISKTLIHVLEEEEHIVDADITPLIGEKLQHILSALGIKKGVEKIRKKFYNIMIKRIKKIKIKPCVPLEPLKKLSKKYPLIVISNAESSFAKLQARQLKIENLFKEIHGAETFETKDEIMKKLFKKHNLNPKEVIYIGDRFTDVEYAKKAGCWAIAIHNKCSWSSKKAVLAEHPDFIIKDFSEIEKTIKKINAF